MSAFLGPIHYWLYRKIGFLEELVGDIAELVKSRGWETDSPESYEYKELPPLEEVIDENNIHNWLQERIIEAERAYAGLVAGIVKGHSERLEQIKKAAYAFGKKRAFAADLDAMDAFRELNNLLVDGMPCDRVNEVVSKSAEAIEWLKLEDLHSLYWEEAGVPGEIYYDLNTELIKGLLAETELKYKSLDENRYRIEK